MITLKNYTAAFLENDGDILLIHRAKSRDFLPNIWSGIGGKIEESEINNPAQACLREIKEETGIQADEIRDLTLRYIVIRQCKNVIRQNYIYFGKVLTKKVVDTDEGSLHWIPKDESLDREFTATYKEMIKHYCSNFSDDKYVFVGTAENHDGNLFMKWSKIEDFE